MPFTRFGIGDSNPQNFHSPRIYGLAGPRDPLIFGWTFGGTVGSFTRAERTVADLLGLYVEVAGTGEDFAALLPITEAVQRLTGHLTGMDHTGIVLPEAIFDHSSWEMFVGKLAAAGNLYRYPTGEPWPFLLPATDAEFASGITHFTAGRAPKFELVRDGSLRCSLIHIDLHTDLPMTEIARRFPPPYGASLPGLEAFFRSVYLLHPWPGMTFRLDLRPRADCPPSDWDTGAWLITAGGRIHSL